MSSMSGLPPRRCVVLYSLAGLAHDTGERHQECVARLRLLAGEPGMGLRGLPNVEARESTSVRRAELPSTGRGDAAAGTWIFRGDGSLGRRYSVEATHGDAAAGRGYFAETSRSDAAAASWIFRGGESRRCRGRHVDIP